MKKAWSYIALFFVGLSAGLLIAIRTAGDEYKAYISKIKSKGKSTQDVVFKPVLSTSDPKTSKPMTKRKQRRIERKKKRSLKRLDKLNLN